MRVWVLVKKQCNVVKDAMSTQLVVSNYFMIINWWGTCMCMQVYYMYIVCMYACMLNEDKFF